MAVRSVAALDLVVQVGQLARQAGKIRGQILDVLIAQRCGHAVHDRVGALAVLVLVQHLHEVILVLAGERGVIRRDAIAVGAVARLAGRGFLLAGGGVVAGRCGAEAERQRRGKEGDENGALLHGRSPQFLCSCLGARPDRYAAMSSICCSVRLCACAFIVGYLRASFLYSLSASMRYCSFCPAMRGTWYSGATDSYPVMP